MQRDPATVAQHLSANVLTDRGGSWRKQRNKLTPRTTWHLFWSPMMTDITLLYHRDGGACWSWADSLPGPPHPQSHLCRETSWRGATRVTILLNFIKHGAVISMYVNVLTTPSEWSASCRWWCRAHTPCRAPTGLCLCSRCWRTGSCGTGFPDRPSEPVYWTGSGFTKDRIQQGH